MEGYPIEFTIRRKERESFIQIELVLGLQNSGIREGAFCPSSGRNAPNYPTVDYEALDTLRANVDFRS